MAAAFSVPHLKTFLSQFQVTASKVGENLRQTDIQADLTLACTEVEG
jgi:hypothetical protein